MQVCNKSKVTDRLSKWNATVIFLRGFKSPDGLHLDTLHDVAKFFASASVPDYVHAVSKELAAILACPMTSVECERSFSIAKRILEPLPVNLDTEQADSRVIGKWPPTQKLLSEAVQHKGDYSSLHSLSPAKREEVEESMLEASRSRFRRSESLAREMDLIMKGRRDSSEWRSVIGELVPSCGIIYGAVAAATAEQEHHEERAREVSIEADSSENADAVGVFCDEYPSDESSSDSDSDASVGSATSAAAAPKASSSRAPKRARSVADED
jgi:hypothetical protein